MLDGRSEKDLTRKGRSTLAQLRSRYCEHLSFYKSRIKKDGSLNAVLTPHDVKHFFVCSTTMAPLDVWS